MNAVYKNVHNFRWAVLPLSIRFLYILICRLWQTAVVLTFPRCLKPTCPCSLRRRPHCLWRSVGARLCLYLCIEQISDKRSLKTSSKRTGLNIFVEIQSISFAVSYSMKFKAFFYHLVSPLLYPDTACMLPISFTVPSLGTTAILCHTSRTTYKKTEVRCLFTKFTIYM